MTKKCPVCGYENADDAVYCESCGAKLAAPASGQGPSLPQGPALGAPQAPQQEGAGQSPPPPEGKIKCPVCGFENEPGTEFCKNCGAKLSVAVAPSKPAASLVLPSGEEIEITSLPRVFGRSDFLRLQHSEYISRKHFEISFENGKYYIVDVGSTNGTSVNHVKVLSKTEIKNGDLIELAGMVSLTFKAP